MYYRWRAYNSQAEESTGVEEAPRFEIIVLRLAQRGLTAALIEKITMEEYIAGRGTQSRISRLQAVKSKFSPDQIPEAVVPRRRFKIAKWLLALATLKLVLLVCWYCIRPNLHNLW